MENEPTFGEFMTDVVNRADKISFEKCGLPLSDKYDAPSTILKMIGSVTNVSWDSFNSMYNQLFSTGSYFLFAGALGSFVTSALGHVLSGALVYWGSKESFKLLYNNKGIVVAVKRIGDKYKSKFDRSTAENRNALADLAANDLYNLDL